MRVERMLACEKRKGPMRGCWGYDEKTAQLILEYYLGWNFHVSSCEKIGLQTIFTTINKPKQKTI